MTIREICQQVVVVGILLGIAFDVLARPLPRFPPSSIWYQDISSLVPDTNSSTMLTSSVDWGGNNGFQMDLTMHVLYSAWGNNQNYLLVQDPDYYLPDCNTDSPIPLPFAGAIEGSSNYSCDTDSFDCHLFVVRGDTLYESYKSNVNVNSLHSMCLIKWHLNLVYPPNGRGEQCTSADAAGFPIAPLLFNADEVAAAMAVNGDIGHAVRFILPNNRMRANVYVHPASHAGSPNGPNTAIPYGARLRLRSSYAISGFNPAAQVLLRTLKKYGMFLSDGGNVPLTGESDTFTTTKWADIGIEVIDGGSLALQGVQMGDFEVMPIGTPIPLTYDCAPNPDDVIFSDSFTN